MIRADSGQPVAEAVVSLFPQLENLGDPVRADHSRRSLHLHRPPGRPYSIGAERNGFVTPFGNSLSNGRLSVRAGQQLTHVELHLIPAGLISGTVIDEDRELVAQVDDSPCGSAR